MNLSSKRIQAASRFLGALLSVVSLTAKKSISMKRSSQIALASILAIATPLFAEIQLAPVFSDNMILQREITIPLRGMADEEKQVSVSFNDNEYTGQVTDGRWQVELPAMPAGGSFEITVTGASNTLTLSNVTFGDIWLCAGQSNMDSAIKTYKDKFPELYKGHPVKQHGQIRIFRAARLPIDEPQEFITREHRFDKGWYPIEPRTRTRLFSATGYFFGLYLAEEVDVPIGLIQSCRGGTPITAWMPPGSLEEREEYAPILQDYQQAVLDWPVNKIDYEKTVQEWEAKKASGAKVGWKPEPPQGPESNKRPYALHNGMIAPLYQLPIKGALWYQGEGNSKTREDSVQYEILLKDLVAYWRSNWGNPSMPVLVVQLPGFGNATKQPSSNNNWPWIRESQKNIEDIENCKAVCILDSGMQKDIHPPYKQNVGKRLAYAARNMVYGQANAPQSPEYRTHTCEGESTLITFDHIGSGLTTGKALLEDTVYNADDVLGFIVMDARGSYQRARGKIVAPNQVRVNHPGISSPKSIRYGWENFPDVNLFGESEMPAFPFRTDTFSAFKK
jgi:sialate O-acetylesterase